MTKADGFRVLRGREGLVVWREAGDRLGLLDRRTGIAGSLPVRRPETLLDMLDIEAEVLDEKSGPDLGLILPLMDIDPRLLMETFCCFRGKWRKCNNESGHSL